MMTTDQAGRVGLRAAVVYGVWLWWNSRPGQDWASLVIDILDQTDKESR